MVELCFSTCASVYKKEKDIAGSFITEFTMQIKSLPCRDVNEVREKGRKIKADLSLQEL